MAKFLVEIPMDPYVRCLAKFDEESPKYLTLREGLLYGMLLTKRSSTAAVKPTGSSQSIMRILAAECPEFLDDIHYYPDPPPAH